VTEGAKQGRPVGGMNTRTATWSAWSVWGAALGFVVVGLLFGILSFSAALPDGREPMLIPIIVQGGLVILYGTLGALIASRRPRNPIGWIFCAMAAALGLLSAAYGYADYALYATGDFLPGAELVAWLTNWLFMAPVFIAPCFLFLLFPDGRPASPRWRPVVWVVAAVAAVAVFATALAPGRLDAHPAVGNPLGLGGSFGEVARVAKEVTEVLAILVFLVSLASVVVRLRRSRGLERLQVKWVAYAAVLTATSFATSFLFVLLPSSQTVADIFFLIGVAGFTSIPVAAGIAILRYRLYEIDFLINRTLVYGSLTVMLVAVYATSIVVLQGLLRALTGQESQLAIVASTLAVAALFNPLRRRVQSFIDRRFYRKKYDARKTLEDFSARLRDETDLDALNAELVGVVRETMQPAHVSLWLRPDAASKKDEAPG
jgi:MFS family permease